VLLLTKKNAAESNTNYAQGGIACVTSAEDSAELHIRDTVGAGAGKGAAGGGARITANSSSGRYCRDRSGDDQEEKVAWS
jgi:aspartate oxidase